MSEADSVWNELAALAVEASDKQHDRAGVRPETSLQGDLGLSSMMVINLVLDLEQKFGISIGQQDFEHVDTLGDLQRLIAAKRARQQ